MIFNDFFELAKMAKTKLTKRVGSHSNPI